jgi:hypothetical protein
MNYLAPTDNQIRVINRLTNGRYQPRSRDAATLFIQTYRPSPKTDYIRLEKRLESKFLAGLPSVISSLLVKYPGTMVAGGFCRSMVEESTPNDIDIFAPSEGVIALIKMTLRSNRNVHYLHYLGEAMFASNYLVENEGRYQTDDRYIKVQLISAAGAIGSPKTILNTFDFTMSKALIFYDGRQFQSLAHRDFETDVWARQLRYDNKNNMARPGGALIRALKFAKSGYTIANSQLSEILMEIVKKAEGLTREEAIESIFGSLYGGDSLYGENRHHHSSALYSDNRYHPIDPFEEDDDLDIPF